MTGARRLARVLVGLLLVLRTAAPVGSTPVTRADASHAAEKIPDTGRMSGIFSAAPGATVVASGYGDDNFADPPSRPDEDPDARPTPRAIPHPVPTEAAPAVPLPLPSPVVPYRLTGTPRSATLVIRAAGRVFRMRGLLLSRGRGGLARIGDPGLDALLSMYGAALRWSGSRRATVATVDGQAVTLPEGAHDVTLGDGGRTRLEVPVLVRGGTAYLPVAVLPAMLPAKLQVRSMGCYQLDPLVTGIDVESVPGGGARLTVACRVPMRWKSFMLRHPDRYVLNLSNAVLDLGRYHEVARRMVQIPDVGEAHFDQFSFLPNVVRVVIPLGESREVRVLPRSTPHQLVVAINSPTAQPHVESFARQRITGMRVTREPSGVRIVLHGSGPFQYEWHRLKPPDNRFFLDITDSTLTGPRRSQSVKDAYVSGVALGQYETKPVPTVRLRMDMSRPADTRVYTLPGAPDTLVVEARHGHVALRSGDLRGFGATRMPSARRIVCIDPGHGGSDPGAMNRSLGICEKDVTLDVARRLAALLRRQGWQVVMTRTSDRDVSYPGSSATEELGARVRVARDFHADLFVCIHCNSSVDHGATGTSTHWYKSADHLLAACLQPPVVRALRSPDRGLQRNRYYVLRHTGIPAVLIEAGFISNRREGRKLADPTFRQRIAVGLAAGLGTYLARSGRVKSGRRPATGRVSTR